MDTERIPSFNSCAKHDHAFALGVRALLRNVLPRLTYALQRRLDRGRSGESDLLSDLVIEDTEAARLLETLDHELSRTETDVDRVTETCGGKYAGLVGQLLSQFEADCVGEIALALSIGVDIDSRIARLVGYLNDHPGHVRPTLGLVWDVANVPIGPGRLELVHGALFRDGILEVSGDGALSTREISVSSDLLPRLLGTTETPDSFSVTRPEGVLDARYDLSDLPPIANAWLEAAKLTTIPPLLVEGLPGSGRTRLALQLFGLSGFGAVYGTSDPRILRREARLSSAGIVAKPRGDVVEWWSHLNNLSIPIAIVVSAEGGESLRRVMATEPFTIRLDIPDVEERTRLWRSSAVGQHLKLEDAEDIAARFPFTPGQIKRVANRAALETWAHGLLPRICREVAVAPFGGLARRLSVPYRREDLLLPQQLEHEFSLAISWVRFRQKVFGEWNLGRKFPGCWGLSVLLTGPPGTGKTMSAQVFAHELDMDIYRVDLSQVVSKYIGETEKHLGDLLSVAQQAGVILLFDEADALFGRRSEVRDARDRYANLEVGYLLQRIEEHEGVVLLSTNRPADMDDAFRRRFQFVMALPLPEKELRSRILGRLLPRELCTRDVNVEVLADRFRLSGGEIRNAVVAAAFMAASDGTMVSQAHLLKALRREVLNAGRALRSEERDALNGMGS